MQTHRITAPPSNPDWTGPFNEQSDVYFVSGMAYTDLPGIVTYCRGAGYGVEPVDQVPAVYHAAVDVLRAGGSVVMGTRLRDAAVNPRQGDVSVPTNAGRADPHGPLVIAPEAITREEQAGVAHDQYLPGTAAHAAVLPALPDLTEETA